MCLVDSATQVFVNLLVRSISKIDDYKMVSGICQFKLIQQLFKCWINQCPICNQEIYQKKLIAYVYPFVYVTRSTDSKTGIK